MGGGLLEFVAEKVLKRDIQSAYIKMLLSKKVFGVILQRNRM